MKEPLICPSLMPKTLSRGFERIQRHIAHHGPISLACYMRLALAGKHGYYRNKSFLGAKGDFITAPEISQLFGEMIGIWCVSLWKSCGSPAQWDLLELGPGRGTMMRDILRVIRRLAPTWGESISPLFLDISKAYRKELQTVFPRCRFYEQLRHISWERPLLILANEFFDALPIYQFVRLEQHNLWAMRTIALEETTQKLIWQNNPLPAKHHWNKRLTRMASNTQSQIIEWAPVAKKMCAFLARCCVKSGSCVLLLDYGAEAESCDTLQASRKHREASPLSNPGDNDLTSHVSFESLHREVLSWGAVSPLPITQRRWLRGMGIEARAAKLSRKNPSVFDDLQRLIHPALMGKMFKVMAFGSQNIEKALIKNWPAYL